MQPNETQPSLISFFDTKEIMKLVLQKLSSQVLLYSVAIVVMIIVAYLIFQKDLFITVLIAIIFIIALVGYLFFEQRTKVKKADSTAIGNLLKNRMTDIQKPSSPFTVKLWTSPATKATAASRDIAVVAADKSSAFSIGDKVLVCFTSSRDGYLTLLNIGTSGRLTVLFPNRMHPDNFVKADELYTIPSPNDGFEYQLQGPGGTEKLKAIVTLQRMALVESDFTTEGGLFKTSNAGVAARDIAVIKKKVEEIASDEWSEASWEFKVL